MTDESINANKTCRITQEPNKKQWPKLFLGFRQTQITARTEGFIDLIPGVLWLNESYLF